jgi:hypothetical protein
MYPTCCQTYKQDFTEGKLMVISRDRKSMVKNLLTGTYTGDHARWEAADSLLSTTMGAHGLYTVLLEAETVALLTVQVIK